MPQDRHFLLHIEEWAKSFLDLFIQRTIPFHGHFLSEISQTQTARPFHRATIRGHNPTEDIEERAFAAAVRANKANVAPCLNLP